MMKNLLDFGLKTEIKEKEVQSKKLKSELFSKGVSSEIIEQILENSKRNDSEEIQKIIAKKAKKYSDEKKLVAYLARQGFSYDEIKKALSKDEF